MIDGFKILNLQIDSKILLNNNYLDFPLSISGKNDGEILNHKRTAVNKNLVFTITPDQIVKLSGSFHKYKNNGVHNYDDFFFSDLKKVISELVQKFGINPNIVKLNNLEYGVNLRVTFDPNLFIKGLISYKGSRFNITERQSQCSAEVMKERYYLKIYNKGLQYGIGKNILRYEIKVIKSEHLKQFNIACLADLLNKENLKLLGQCLVASFDSILYWDDTINMDTLTQKERDKLLNGQSPFYWENLLQNHRRAYFNKVKKFRTLVQLHGKNNFAQIRDLISTKWDELLNDSGQNIHELTVLKNSLPVSKCARINISNKVLISASSKKANDQKCLVTGLDISMQKEKSKFLCISGIRYYFENDEQVYSELKKRLAIRWKDEPLEIKFREIAHSIRNEFFNPKNNIKKSIKRINIYPTLFPTNEFIKKEKLYIITT